jgi:hypothetical protein
VKEIHIWKTSVLVQKSQELNSLHLIILFVQIVKENHILQTIVLVKKSQQLHSPQLIILSVQIVKEIHILQTDDLVLKPSNGLILLISLLLNFCSSCERNSHPAERIFLYKNDPTASFFSPSFSIFVQSCETHTTLQTNFLV